MEKKHLVLKYFKAKHLFLDIGDELTVYKTTIVFLLVIKKGCI